MDFFTRINCICFNGACLSSMRVRVEIKNFAKESRLRFSTLAKAAAISLLNSEIPIFLSWHQENVVLGAVGLGRSSQIVLWPELLVSSINGQIINFEEALILTKSIVWPE